MADPDNGTPAGDGSTGSSDPNAPATADPAGGGDPAPEAAPDGLESDDDTVAEIMALVMTDDYDMEDPYFDYSRRANYFEFFGDEMVDGGMPDGDSSGDGS